MSNDLKQFRLTITRHSSMTNFGVASYDVIEADGLTELLSKFLVVLGTIHHHLIEEMKLEHRLTDDDIPF